MSDQVLGAARICGLGNGWVHVWPTGCRHGGRRHRQDTQSDDEPPGNVARLHSLSSPLLGRDITASGLCKLLRWWRDRDLLALTCAGREARSAVHVREPLIRLLRTFAIESPCERGAGRG